MIYRETPLKGAFAIAPEKAEDMRGFFSRTWSRREFAAHGLDSDLVECNVSFNSKKGTLRGMHYQGEPHAQAKLVRCTSGAVYDVIIDLRADAATFKQWFALELSAANRMMLYVPVGFAHGFQTLMDETEVFYQMSDYYAPECAHGVRWNDPAFKVEWPPDERIIIARDREYPDYRA